MTTDENEKARRVDETQPGNERDDYLTIVDQAAQCKLPTPAQVYAAPAVLIDGCERAHRWLDDKLFRQLQSEAAEVIGTYKLADKRIYFRRVCCASYRSAYRNDLTFVELHLAKLPGAQRRVLDALVETDRLIPYPSRDGFCTRYLVTEKFRAELLIPGRQHRSEIESVEYRHRKQKIRRGRRIVKIESKKAPFDYNHPVAVATRKLLDPVNDFNGTFRFRSYRWNPFTSEFDGRVKEYNSFLTAKFFDDFTTYGRMHTSRADGYQTTRVCERGRFFIDGLLCDELDYKCLHPRLAYNLLGLPCPDDCYLFLGQGPAARRLAKKVLNTSFNAATEYEAIGSFRQSKAHWKHASGSNAAKNAKKLNRAWREMGKPGPHQLFEAARESHKPIEEYFFADAGMMFMRHDSEIALKVVHKLAAHGIPAANFHDSFLVPLPHVEDLRFLMDVIYAAKLGFRPVIEAKERSDEERAWRASNETKAWAA